MIATRARSGRTGGATWQADRDDASVRAGLEGRKGRKGQGEALGDGPRGPHGAAGSLGRTRRSTTNERSEELCPLLFTDEVCFGGPPLRPLSSCLTNSTKVIIPCYYNYFLRGLFTIRNLCIFQHP